MHCVVRQNFTEFAHLDQQDLSRVLALVLAGVFVTAAETQAVGSSELRQLPLSGKDIGRRRGAAAACAGTGAAAIGGSGGRPTGTI